MGLLVACASGASVDGPAESEASAGAAGASGNAGTSGGGGAPVDLPDASGFPDGAVGAAGATSFPEAAAGAPNGGAAGEASAAGASSVGGAAGAGGNVLPPMGCVPGAKLQKGPCGTCGQWTATCSMAGTYDADICEGEQGECLPGSVDDQSCGNCGNGHQQRTCGATCTWGAFGACGGSTCGDGHHSCQWCTDQGKSKQSSSCGSNCMWATCKVVAGQCGS